MKNLLLCVHVVVETLNLEISRCHLADYVKELNLSACHMCSTIIFPHLANQIINLCRCGCHVTIQSVSSGANLYKREAHHQIRIQWSSGICSCLQCSRRKRCHRLSQHGRTHSYLNKATKQINELWKSRINSTYLSVTKCPLALLVDSSASLLAKTTDIKGHEVSSLFFSSSRRKQ